MPYDHGLARLSREQCLALFAGATLGRVGISVDALPAILPVTIALLDDRVVFRTIPGTKLDYAAVGSILAVEADRYDPATGEGWSVLVRGIASVLTEATLISRARALLAHSWIGDASAEHYVGVNCDLVTGRRLRATPAATGSA